MKNSVLIVSVLLLCLSMGCKKNDASAPMEIVLQNEPPLSFSLFDVPDGATNVDIIPTLTWESAENPKGSAVAYDLYLDTNVNPTTLYESNIGDTSYEVTPRLNLVKDYYWKVVAKDLNGKTSQSSIYKFTTRNLNIPEEPMTLLAAFAPRRLHTSVAYDNKMWVIGGEDPIIENHLSDVWYSNDGDIWVEATQDAAFTDRVNHTSTVFDNKIWVIGGQSIGVLGGKKNDVWYSTDGVNWNEATNNASFSGRRGHSTVVFDNKIWVIGGRDVNGHQNDVWYSTNGADWQMATASADFPVVSRHASVVFDDKIWVIGGEFIGGAKRNEIWYSTDGVKWTQATSSPTFSERSRHTATVFDNKIWIIGGSGNQSEPIYDNEIWYSHDGVNWEQTVISGQFLERRPENTAIVRDEKLWVIGELFTNGMNAKSEVWALD